MTIHKAEKLSIEIGCGIQLAQDLLILAGQDDELVKEASSACHGVESMKAYIINKRFNMLEK